MQSIRNRTLHRVAVSITLCCILWVAASPPTDAFLVNLGYQLLRSLDYADPIRHDIELELVPGEQTAKFTDRFTMRVRNRTGTLYVILGRDYRVERITDAAGSPLQYGPYLDWQFLNLPFVIYRIQLPQTAQANDVVSLQFEYRFSPDTAAISTPFVGPELFAVTVGMFWYPQMPRESFFEAAVTMRAPEGWTLIAEGEPVGPEGEVRWESAVPVPGFGLIAGRFEPVEAFFEPWRIVGWRAGGRDRYLDEMMQHTADALTFFSDRLGQLELERFDVVELPVFATGSIAQLSAWMYPEFLEFAGVTDTYLRAHEAAWSVAFKWIGFTAGFELLGTSWVSQGLTDYLAMLAVEATYGPEAFRYVIEERSIRPLSQYTGPMRALSSIEPTELLSDERDLVFQKGALVFRALHRRLGDEAFFAGVREFVERYRYGHATAQDFLAVMAEVSGQDLRSFERDWVNGTQILDYSLADVSVTPSGSSYRVSFRVVSQGRLVEPRPADVAIHLDDGTVFRVGVQPSNQTTSLTFRSPVVKVELDPDYWLPDWNRDGHVWTAE